MSRPTAAPIMQAIQQGTDRAEAWQNAQTLAAGLRVPAAFADRLILRAFRESGGTAIGVRDPEIVTVQKELAEGEGLFAAPEGAAAWAGVKRLVSDGWIKPQEQVEVLITGSGLK